MCVCAQECKYPQKQEASDPPELGLQALGAAQCGRWGTRPCIGRSLDCWVISLAL